MCHLLTRIPLRGHGTAAEATAVRPRPALPVSVGLFYLLLPVSPRTKESDKGKGKGGQREKTKERQKKKNILGRAWAGVLIFAAPPPSSSRGRPIVTVRPTLISRKNSKTASVEILLPQPIDQGSLGRFRPHSFPTSFHIPLARGARA